MTYDMLVGCVQDHVDAKVVVAGLSKTCSQKIHNQLVCNVILFLFLKLMESRACYAGEKCDVL